MPHFFDEVEARRRIISLSKKVEPLFKQKVYPPKYSAEVHQLSAGSV